MGFVSFSYCAPEPVLVTRVFSQPKLEPCFHPYLRSLWKKINNYCHFSFCFFVFVLKPNNVDLNLVLFLCCMLEIQSLLVLSTELINLQCLKWLKKTCVNWNVTLSWNRSNRTTYRFTAFFLWDDFYHYSSVFFLEKHLDVVDQATIRIRS